MEGGKMMGGTERGIEIERNRDERGIEMREE
jgi:hypothetical protein